VPGRRVRPRPSAGLQRPAQYRPDVGGSGPCSFSRPPIVVQPARLV
jgi:hypothetical protein